MPRCILWFSIALFTVSLCGQKFAAGVSGQVTDSTGAIVPGVSVLDFGADPTGAADSRAAIQAAINAVASKGGTVRLPKGTYFVNSFVSSRHPWKFVNILIPSNVTLDGDPGTVLLQGPGGRQLVVNVPGAAYVENTLLAVAKAATFQLIAFQDPTKNGGFYAANATNANDRTITTTTPANAGNFAAGNYIGIYSATTGDVILSEMSQVESVNANTGVITLAYALARGFATPSVVNITSLATAHVRIRNLTLQGAAPLNVQEAFDVGVENCNLITDFTIGRSNSFVQIGMNTVRDFHMSDSIVRPIGTANAAIELPQRNSQDVTFERNTFIASSVGVGEYPAHWHFNHNHVWLTYNSTTGAGLNGFPYQGWDMEAVGNDIHAGDFSGSGASCITDDAGALASTSGQIRFIGNTIDCAARGNYAVSSKSPGTSWIGNTITAKPGTVGAQLLSDNVVFSGNLVSVAAVTEAISLGALSAVDSGTISDNTFVGNETAKWGILLTARSTLPTGGYLISGNTMIGFSSGAIEPTRLSSHPGTRIVGSPTATSP